MPSVGIRARRWHPGTSLASNDKKTTFFQKKTGENFAICEIRRTFASSNLNVMDNKTKELYLANKSAKVKDVIVCPICGSKFIKKQYSQAFCCVECKDKFWNKKCSNRHKNPNYHHNYNMKHPERILRVMPTLTARDRDEQFAMSEYLHNEEFKRYVDQPHDDESLDCHVDLITEWYNYHGID